MHIFILSKITASNGSALWTELSPRSYITQQLLGFWCLVHQLDIYYVRLINIIGFVLIYFNPVLVVCHFNIDFTDADVMHDAGCLPFPAHLVPLPIWMITSCPFFIILGSHLS